MAKYIVLTSGTTWIVPNDWNSDNNLVEAFGAGGNGSTIAGGGGGAYANATNVSFIAGQSVTYQIGAGGGTTGSGTTPTANTWFKDATTLIAAGGASAVTSTPGAGGTVANSVGVKKYSGGAGAGTTNNNYGGGAGGAGTMTANGSDGNAGATDSPGAGGGSFSFGPGNPGDTSFEWGTLSDFLVGFGAGGGGSGGQTDAIWGNFNGGKGGVFGGGGAGGGGQPGGAGAAGGIIITYVPINEHFNSPDGDLEKIFVSDYQLIDQFASTGSLWTWGRNNFGQIGDGTVVDKSSPAQTIASGTNWKHLDTFGVYTTLTLKTDNSLWEWGLNNIGQLGDGTVVSKSSPIQLSTDTNWKQISNNNTHSAGIKTDGSLWCWGQNLFGQLGDNTTINKSSPIQTNIGGTDWLYVSTGNQTTAAIKTDGTLWLWGRNDFGQVGDNTTGIHRSVPQTTVAGGTDWKTVSCGMYHWIGMKTNNSVWGCGYNLQGQSGNNSTANLSSPVQTTLGGTDWRMASAGGYHSAAIKRDGTLWLWGRGTFGQLGRNSTTNGLTPQTTVAGGTNWKQVSGGGFHTVAIKTDGTLWAWGNNQYGQLGDNSTVHRSSPQTTVAGGTNWKVAEGLFHHSAAIYFYDANNLYPQ